MKSKLIIIYFFNNKYVPSRHEQSSNVFFISEIENYLVDSLLKCCIFISLTVESNQLRVRDRYLILKSQGQVPHAKEPGTGTSC